MGAREGQIGDKERRAERLSLDEATRLRPNDWSSLEVRMIDLSSTGFRANCEARLLTGGAVSLEVPGLGWIEAQVEWQRGDMFGARFFQPIDIKACGWTAKERESALAQLLIERAAARRDGRPDIERRLRQQILAALPIQKGSARA